MVEEKGRVRKNRLVRLHRRDKVICLICKQVNSLEFNCKGHYDTNPTTGLGFPVHPSIIC